MIDAGVPPPDGMTLPTACGVEPGSGLCPTGATCTNGTCTGGDPSALAIDVRTVTVTYGLTIGGQSCGNAQVSSCPMLLLAETGAGAAGNQYTLYPDQPTKILPSTYDVTTSDGKIIASGMVIRSDQTIPVALALPVELAGTYSQTASGGACDPAVAATQELRFTSDGGAVYTTKVQCSGTASIYSVDVEPGTYQIEARTNATSTPANPVVIRSGLVVTSAQTSLALKVGDVAISGKISVDGTVHDCSSLVSNHVILTVPAKGWSYSLPITCVNNAWGFSGTVHPETYHAAVDQLDGVSVSGSVKPGAYPADAALDVTAARTGVILAVSSTRTNVSGTVTLPGVGADDCGFGVYFDFDDDAKDLHAYTFDQNLCQGPGYAFSTDLSPGTYRVSVRGGPSFPKTTLNPALVVGTSAISGLSYTINRDRVAGTITVNGSAWPDCTVATTVELRGQDGTVMGVPSTCAAGATRFDGAIRPGTYDVFFEGYMFPPGSSSSSRRVYLRVAHGLVVNADKTGLALSASAEPIAGTITVDGEPPVFTDCYRGDTNFEVSFTDSSGSSGIATSICDHSNPQSSFAGLIPAGSLHVAVRKSLSDAYDFPMPEGAFRLALTML